MTVTIGTRQYKLGLMNMNFTPTQINLIMKQDTIHKYLLNILIFHVIVFIFYKVVWADSDHVGCGATIYERDDYWRYNKLYVCNYGPG